MHDASRKTGPVVGQFMSDEDMYWTCEADPPDREPTAEELSPAVPESDLDEFAGSF